MAENLIHRFKTYQFKEPYEHVKQSVVTHIADKLHRYEEDKGRSFSYFSFIGRNFLFAGNQKAYEKKIIHDDITLIDESEIKKLHYEINDNEIFSEDSLEVFFSMFVEYLDKHFYTMFTDDKTQRVVDALLQLMQVYEGMDFFDKKTIYHILRESSGCNTPTISKTLKIIKPLFAKFYEQYREFGEIVGPPLLIDKKEY